ncbi:HAMP domain-containing sensor histidine kinase [Nannocystis sp. ILAH1]|uniref:sensor histidine kinase n=1 Tax=unclassified Nannocystis TaxID=2627009 RepID=UPI00226EB182|nr:MULTISPECIES: HAMP domain-containing sensor histidine kinase [unclassified Nannocystis]MCY0986705.1 HAMP domain-containing sensor histidine kinase [Nannocystis sp. ILAH1]MCY1071584.1 HAMP domain-containing sensor histidine kinase [Nannocystis sp. RBIL2]
MPDRLSPPSSRAHAALRLRERLPAFVELFDGAEMLVEELAELLEATDEAAPADAASGHGAGRAREDAGPEALAREFATLRRAVAGHLDPADREGEVGEALHELLDRQYAAAMATLLREREAQLLEMVAHDISNPLMNICLCRDYLTGLGGGSPEQEMVSEMLQSASQRLQDVTRGLHEVADLRGSPELLERTPLDMVELVTEAVGRASSTSARKVRIEQSLQLGEASVLGDHERLVRAVGSALQSALRAAGGDRAVTLRGEVAGGEIVLRVSDVIADLGRPSLARRRTTTELFVARSIVEAHGGRLWHEPSPAGGGMTLAIGLPVATAPGG